MRTNGLVRPFAPVQVERLESRLLLSWLAGPAGPELVSPAPVTEAESLNGPRNDSPATAEALVFSPLLDWPIGVPGGPGLARLQGVADGLGGAGAAWSAETWMFGTWAGGMRYSASLPGAVAPGTDGVLTVRARADLAGESKFLRVWAEGFDLGSVFVGDGVTGAEVVAQISVPRALLATLAADGVIGLELEASADMVRVGTSYASVSLSYAGASAGGSADYFRVDLAAGERLDLSLTGEASLALSVTDAKGQPLQTGQDDGAGTLGLAGFVAEVDGAYFVRIAGEGVYDLTASLNLALEQPDFAVPLPAAIEGRQWAIGTLADGLDRDAFTVTVDAGSLLKVRVQGLTPGLAPVVRLYDAAGTLVAQSDLVAVDGVAGVNLRTPGAGTYTLEVASADGSTGDYFLEVQSKELGRPRANDLAKLGKASALDKFVDAPKGPKR